MPSELSNARAPSCKDRVRQGLRQARTLAHAHGRGVACLHIDFLLMALRMCLFTIRTNGLQRLQ